MTIEEAEDWLKTETYVRCKEIETSFIFDCMLWEDDTVLLRQASPIPVDLYILSMDVFAQRFAPLGD